jgi:hypothetical protein
LLQLLKYGIPSAIDVFQNSDQEKTDETEIALRCSENRIQENSNNTNKTFLVARNIPWIKT